MSQKKLLIVEDNPVFSSELEKCLKNGGFLVFTASSVQKALEIIKTEKPDGISLDIQLEDSLGFNLINTLISDNYYNGTIPMIIVVSSLIGLQTIPILNQNQIPYYDKSLPTFRYEMILDYFIFGLKNNANSLIPNIQPKEQTVPLMFNNDNLRNLIKQKLDVYGFNKRATAYERLVEGVYYTLLPAENQMNTLTSIFVDVLNVDFNTAFVSMKKLLIDTFKQNPKVFYDIYHKSSKEELLNSGLKEIPTPADFIYHIAEEIRKQNN